MPRQPDPRLQTRILEAARRLFAKGGEHSLSMRHLARLARTNTPAVYRRFRDRDAILRALVELYRRDCYDVLEPCRSLEEISQALLAFALSRPREYELFFSQLISKVSDERPNLEFVKRRCAEWLGGSPADYSGLVLALTALIHGTAMLLISKYVTPMEESRMRSVFSASLKLLLRNATELR